MTEVASSVESERSARMSAQILADPVDVAARNIGISRTTAYELIAKGILRSFKIGTRRLVSRRAQNELVELLESEGQKQE